ncbi:unnamed protein product [Protopolystoma xenopodis]|uniref:Uncharacterized protein n=1 Tax=Protopolystoma xenopodis TaxID=117903 RepID=A0A448XHY7_9PLAT|nr:unnamed protein product [Protopolystoma xenopodis]
MDKQLGQQASCTAFPSPEFGSTPVLHGASSFSTSTHNLTHQAGRPKPRLNTSSNAITSHGLSAASAAATIGLTADRCSWCQAMLEQYDEVTLGLGLVCLATFVHREPSLAAPYLLDMLLIASRLASSQMYSWKTSLPHIIVPGNTASIARQFIRCTLYNLAPNGLFVQLFQTPINDENFFKVVVSVLIDFEDHLTLFQPASMALDALNRRKTLPVDTLPVLLENLAAYIDQLPGMTDDAKSSHLLATGWSELIAAIDTFLRRLVITSSPIPGNLSTCIRIMISVMRTPVAANFKVI